MAKAKKNRWTHKKKGRKEKEKKEKEQKKKKKLIYICCCYDPACRGYRLWRRPRR